MHARISMPQCVGIRSAAEGRRREVIEQIADDIATVGLSQERIIVKSDQEVSITDVQNALVKVRAGFGTAVENSRVGDSNSNGRIERAIQDIKGLIRTLRSFVESMTGSKIELTDPSCRGWSGTRVC